MNIRIINSVCLLILLFLLTACASKMVVNVNAISNNSLTSPGSRYVLTSAMPDIDEQDLHFREFSRYFQHVLQKQGFTRVANKKDADIEIRFRFGLSDGRTGITTYSMPIYDHVGGYSISVPVTTTDGSGNTTTTTRTIHVPSRIQRVGTSLEARSYTLYNKTAWLEARLPDRDSNKGEVLWMLSINSVDSSSDLRSKMPYLAAATMGYIGKNTGAQREIILNEENPLVLELRKMLDH